jgi:hypothetical protein
VEDGVEAVDIDTAGFVVGVIVEDGGVDGDIVIPGVWIGVVQLAGNKAKIQTSPKTINGNPLFFIFILLAYECFTDDII